MANRVMVVLMVDGLRGRALGAYGNTAYSTPALDQFASQSLVFDRYLGESTSLTTQYDALWHAEPIGSKSPDGTPHLIKQLVEQGYLCHLVTDEPTLADRADCELFDHVTLVELPEPVPETQPAAEVFDTAMGRTLEAAADVLGEWSAEYEQPRLLWVHLSGLTGVWDAPTDLAASLLDEDDPELEPSVLVPDHAIASGDTDEAFLASCRYAGQVMVLDRALGAIDNLLAELWPEVPATAVLAGARGFALGEHNQLGMGGPAHRELFHLPLMVRGECVEPLQRQAALLQPADLQRLLIELASDRCSFPDTRQIAAGSSDESVYLETDEWSYIVVPATETEPPAERLYVQPDDAWQANDIASLCPEQLDQFAQLRREIDIAQQQGEPWSGFQLAPPAEPPQPDA